MCLYSSIFIDLKSFNILIFEKIHNYLLLNSAEDLNNFGNYKIM